MQTKADHPQSWPTATQQPRFAWFVQCASLVIPEKLRLRRVDSKRSFRIPRFVHTAALRHPAKGQTVHDVAAGGAAVSRPAVRRC
eukprot:357333-Chlamydomonas_euryale.AAC.1